MAEVIGASFAPRIGVLIGLTFAEEIDPGGQARSLDEILGGIRMVAEGVQTTYAAMDLAARLGVELPITRQMYAVLKERKSPREGLRELMERSLKEE